MYSHLINDDYFTESSNAQPHQDFSDYVSQQQDIELRKSEYIPSNISWSENFKFEDIFQIIEDAVNAESEVSTVEAMAN